MQELKLVIDGIIEQTEDIFEHFGAKPVFVVEQQTVRDLTVTFTYVTKSFNGKTQVFYYNHRTKSEDEFINEIKAYMLDCVDTFINFM